MKFKTERKEEKCDRIRWMHLIMKKCFVKVNRNRIKSHIKEIQINTRDCSVHCSFCRTLTRRLCHCIRFVNIILVCVRAYWINNLILYDADYMPSKLIKNPVGKLKWQQCFQALNKLALARHCVLIYTVCVSMRAIFLF